MKRSGMGVRRVGRVAVWAAVLLASAVIGVPSAMGATLVVAQGDAAAGDGNPGTDAAPLKTIGRAVAMAKTGDTVLVKAGTYPEAVTIAVSGEKDRPIVLQAAPGQRVVIGGERRCGITWAAGVGYVVIDGFEVRGGGDGRNEGSIGATGEGGHHVTVRNCVLVRCRILLTGQSDCTIRRCVQTGCRNNGVSLAGCKGCVVEECEIYGNGADGLVVTHGSDGCTVRRNYIHNHWYDSHPDAIQVYRGVTNFTVEDNLFFNSGQGFMMEQTDGGVFRNNIIAGTHQSGILLGHRNTHNWRVEGNTIAYTGFRAVVYSGKNTTFLNNVITTGGDNKLIQKAGEFDAVSDYNLLWKSNDGTVYHPGAGQGQHSKFADPKFRCAPPLADRVVHYVDRWADEEAPGKCTVNKLTLGRKNVPAYFNKNDRIEVNFDGIERRVTEVGEDYVAFDPPLRSLHKYVWDVVVNWRDAPGGFKWDLRLADDSPGKGMGDKGQDVGSNIDMQAYMRGDFDGDGKRDLPALPEAEE